MDKLHDSLKSFVYYFSVIYAYYYFREVCKWVIDRIERMLFPRKRESKTRGQRFMVRRRNLKDLSGRFFRGWWLYQLPDEEVQVDTSMFKTIWTSTWIGKK